MLVNSVLDQMKKGKEEKKEEKREKRRGERRNENTTLIKKKEKHSFNSFTFACHKYQNSYSLSFDLIVTKQSMCPYYCHPTVHTEGMV
ncbi:MAG: hypothetical protein GY874_18740 [Desulfobacteraceae bacterium]|nr:hypothetical protein [Desulfobacteraceae bacterium]